MKIVCERCGQQGPSAGTWRRDDLIALECSHCGHINRLSEEVPAQAKPIKQPPEPNAVVQPTAADQPSKVGVQRCPRCAHPSPSADACDRCGFAFANYRPGEMPWEKAPPGKEDAWQNAQTLWSTREAATDDNARAAADDAILKFCIAAGLEDWAARQYRFILADHPQDPAANHQLTALIQAAQTKLLTQLKSERAVLDTHLSRTRQVLLWGLVCVALVLLGYYFVKSQF